MFNLKNPEKTNKFLLRLMSISAIIAFFGITIIPNGFMVFALFLLITFDLLYSFSIQFRARIDNIIDPQQDDK